MEWAARDAVKPYLLDGHDTVGTHVNIRHLAATPIGCKARFKAEVIEVTDRRVRFQVDAWDEKDKIGEGTHDRAIIDISRFAQRLRTKRPE
jgi:predicted thioesterase